MERPHRWGSWAAGHRCARAQGAHRYPGGGEVACAAPAGLEAGLEAVLSPSGLICDHRGLCRPRQLPTRPGEGPGSSETHSLPGGVARWEVNSDWRPRTSLPKASGETDVLPPHPTRPPGARHPFPTLLGLEAFSRTLNRGGGVGWGAWRGACAESGDPARCRPRHPWCPRPASPAHTIHGFINL